MANSLPTGGQAFDRKSLKNVQANRAVRSLDTPHHPAAAVEVNKHGQWAALRNLGLVDPHGNVAARSARLAILDRCHRLGDFASIGQIGRAHV